MAQERQLALKGREQELNRLRTVPSFGKGGDKLCEELEPIKPA